MTRFSAATGTRTGDRHTREGTGNQDYAHYAFLPGDKGIVAAVSDGAGSAPRAAEGSETAARAAVDKALAAASGECDGINLAEMVAEGIKAAREALENKALSDGAALEEYHATLLVAALSGTHAAVAHIGDGASIANVGGKYKMLTIPARGIYANETFFVTMDNYEEMVAANDTCDVTEVILFTDGAQDELIDFQGKKPRAEAAEAAAECLSGESEEFTHAAPDPDSKLREWIEYRERTHHDDATILVMRRLEDGE